MVVSIHQPCYLPYLGVFYKIWQSDMFVYLDDAQYSNGYVFDWNRIKTPQGESRLKVPTARVFGQTLNQVTPKDFLGWREKHLKTIRMNYKKAPYFAELYPILEETIMQKHNNLADLNIALMDKFIFLLGFGTRVERTKSSWMKLDTRAEDRVIEIVKRLGGDTYISGTGGRGYQNEEHFTNAGIKLVYSDFKPLEYQQQWGDYLPNMSVVDYCMNEGFDIDGFFRRIKEAGQNGE